MFWKDKHLPFCTGPYVPACVDVMTEYSNEGSFFRLHYPSFHSNIQDFQSRWIPWIFKEERNKHLTGLSRMLRIWTCVIKAIFFLFGGRKKVPVIWQGEFRKDHGKFPVIIYSHGMGASRCIYSTFCNELASYGFIVAAVEHRDGSSCATYYYDSKEARDKKQTSWIPFQVVNDDEHYLSTRKKQIQQRSSECIKVIDVLNRINSGAAVDNIVNNSCELIQFKDCLNMDNLIVAGHSFGGATALLSMSKDSRFKMGIILDGWMYPLVGEKLHEHINQPLLFICSETFSTKANSDAINSYIINGIARKIFTIKGMIHENQTDIPVLLGYWRNIWMKKLPAEVVARINFKMVIDFLSIHAGFPNSTMNDDVLQVYSPNIIEGLSIPNSKL